MATPAPASPASTTTGVGIPRPIKVFFVCTSLGNTRRGIESFFREAFDAMHGYPGLQAELYKGGGKDAPDEYRLWCFPKFSWPARILAKLIRRNGYVVEQLSFLPAIIRRIRRGNPDIIFYSDANLAMRLQRWRKKIGVPYRLMYSNGAPVKPPFDGADHVQQVTPLYYQEALDFGESPAKHSLVPYGIKMPAGDPVLDLDIRSQLRQHLNLPVDRKILISVGWISAYHKRMDYVINEVASLPVAERPFVVLLGEIDEASPPVIALAKQKLGEANFAIRSVPYEQVNDYYQSADVFTLASLKEGFGRVYLEALIQGLPCVVNDHPVTRYVLGDEGVFGDLSKPGELASRLPALLSQPPDPAAMARRREHVRRNFGWDALRPAYLQMFKDCYHNSRPLENP